MTTATIQWELTDLGICYPDYFQGFGIAFTTYNRSVVGIGDTPREALENILEQLAQGGSADRIEELERDILAEYPDLQADDQPSAYRYWLDHRDCDCDPDCLCDACEDLQSFTPYYHLGLRYNLWG